MQIRMLRDFPVSPDGQRVESWHQGDVHTIADEAGASMIRDGIAALFLAPLGGDEQKIVEPQEPARKKKR